MRAWTYERYGPPVDVLDLEETPIPTPSEGRVLIRVRAASVNPLDWHLMTGLPRFLRVSMGLRRPKRTAPGADVSGVVEAVGAGVTRFRPGDEVFGEIDGGSLAEYAVGLETDLVPKPPKLSFEEAAALPVAGLTALQGLRDWGGIAGGERVLINGASGGVGTFAVQIAKLLGADVTAVCSTLNVDTARRLGADRVIDYTRDDFTEADLDVDLVFDGPGNRSLRDLRRVMAPGSVHVLIGGPKGGLIQPIPYLLKMKLMSLFLDYSSAGGVANANVDDLTMLAQWMESGDIEAVVDRNYKLDDVPDALMYQGDFHARGKIVITI